MKIRSFTLTLSLATIVFVAIPLIAEQECSTDTECNYPQKLDS